ncbi:S9 family peptidase [Serratia ficaria]|uniref:S9 family peptidase n=1 Tax=Serratia ficaria TaxID=61651 RepID=UPI0021793D36|nr:S9 family peptidase [Serratia ficaria]CAI1201056.1 Prolyl tripeptidyl peptidase precursor [Serratia ficaria]CAI2527387.1 Prolyl tripeptidyl peptidase precursor [Serratia ficaria]CAI2536329.1 Prolyl tripeptidyl peptidase precursor [Serratia ficaria]
MTLSSFQNDPQVYAVALKRLTAYVEARNVVKGSLHWDGSRGSIAGCLIESADDAQWESLLGLPRWFAYLLDQAISNLNVPDALEESRLLLGAIPVGKDISAAGYDTIAALLDEVTVHDSPDAALSKALERVRTLHLSRAHGGEASADDWKKARRAALAASDALPSLPENPRAAAPALRRQHAIGGMIEAAAWDPLRSPTAAAEVLRHWLALQALNINHDFGWTPADDEKAERLLSEMYDSYITPNPEEKRDVFQLLAEHYPVEEARLKDYNHFHKRHAAETAKRACALLARLLPLAGLIPRRQLFGNPQRVGANISPDGRWLSWAATGSQGVMNVWAAPIDSLSQARQLTQDQKRGVQGHFWSYDSAHILYSQDKDGDENYQIYAVHVVSGKLRCLTPFPGTRSGVVALSRRRRNDILISMNRRDPRFADLYTLNLTDGELTLVLENSDMDGFITDDDFEPHFAHRTAADGGLEILKRDAAGAWRIWERFSAEDARNSGISHLDRDGRYLYLFDSRDRDTAALLEVDLANDGVRRVLAEHPLADIGDVLSDRETLRPLAYRVHYERPQRYLLDDSLCADVAFLDAQMPGYWWPGTRTEDDRLWLVNAFSDTQPGTTYLYDRSVRTVTKLFDIRPELSDCALARMQSFTVTSRDGLPLVCYLSLPRELDAGESLRAPLVVLVHGGPWSRDGFGYNTNHQWLCNRGYAVLNVNFRGSTGFGKRFINAGDGEWGRRMDDDVEDAVDWVVANGLADPARMAIVGTSYGGYAVLSALTQRPGRYVCGIDVVGPANLETLMHAIPPHWESGRKMLYRAVGNPETEAGRALLRERSPLHAAGAIRDPLLIAQGANDPRVPQRESDLMAQALVEHGIPVTYALFPDEGHGFSREPNRLIFNALMESFLALHLGGRAEPFVAEDFPGNTLRIVVNTDSGVTL